MAALQFFTPNPRCDDSVAFDWGSSVTLSPVIFPEQVPWVNVGLIGTGFVNGAGTTNSATVSIGLYSLRGSTLSLLNSGSGSWTVSNGAAAVPVNLALSATSYFGPGMYYLAMNGSISGIFTAANVVMGLVGMSSNSSQGGPRNAWAGFFQGGTWTSATTNAFPASMPTSDFGVTFSSTKTGNSASDLVGFMQPYILMSI